MTTWCMDRTAIVFCRRDSRQLPVMYMKFFHLRYKEILIPVGFVHTETQLKCIYTRYWPLHRCSWAQYFIVVTPNRVVLESLVKIWITNRWSDHLGRAILMRRRVHALCPLESWCWSAVEAAAEGASMGGGRAQASGLRGARLPGKHCPWSPGNWCHPWQRLHRHSELDQVSLHLQVLIPTYPLMMMMVMILHEKEASSFCT